MDTNLNINAGFRAPSPPVTVAREVVTPQDSGDQPTVVVAARGDKRANSEPVQDQQLSLAQSLVAEFDSAENIEQREEAVARLNEILRDRARELEFTIDEDTGRTILKVIHAESGEVIRQIPPEELLQIARTFIEGTGSLIKDSA